MVLVSFTLPIFNQGKMLKSVTVSWDAWPKAGQYQMTMNEDLVYKHCLADKKYMMGVSPYFYASKFPMKLKNRVRDLDLTTQTCRNGIRTGMHLANHSGLIDGSR